MQYNTVQCNAMQCNTVQYNAMQYKFNTISYKWFPIKKNGAPASLKVLHSKRNKAKIVLTFFQGPFTRSFFDLE